MTNDHFWLALEMLVSESEIVIDRPKGSAHPRYPDFVYPLDYGYLKGTAAMDGGGIDIWRGSGADGKIDAIMCTIDLVKHDSEIKILVGCTEDEKALVYRVYNETDMMKGILMRRELCELRRNDVWYDGRLKDRVEYRLSKDERLAAEAGSLKNEWPAAKAGFAIEPLRDNHRAFVDKQIANSWAGPHIAAHGMLFDTRSHPGYVAVRGGAVVGYILYNLAGGDCEITVLESLQERLGVGSTLISAVAKKARNENCRRVWLVTTNDNINAFRFYQRRGFELRAVHIGAMEQARKLKPQIPPLGNEGIPIKHEFEFEMALQ